MARTGIKNISSGPITLPLPLHGVLQPNKSVISSLTLAEADTLFNTANLAKQVRCKDLADVGDVTTGLEGNVSMNGVKITDVGTPTANADAATKLYVDQAGPASGLLYTPGQTADWPGTDPNDVAEALDKLAARTDADLYEFVKAAADGAAGDATAEFVFAEVLRAGTIVSARYIPTGTLDGDDTDYATLSLAKRDGAGGAPAAVASFNTKDTGGSGDWAAFVGESLGAISNAAVVAGDLLTFAIAKAASGKIVPAGTLVVVVEPASGA